MNSGIYAIAFTTVLLGTTVVYPTCLSYLLFLILLVISIILGIFTALWINIMLSLPHKTIVGAEHTLKQAEHFRNRLMKEYDSSTVKIIPTNIPHIFGRTVDSLLQQLLDFVIRDYILIYLNDYAYKLELLEINIKSVGRFMGAVKALHEKLSRVDHAKLIACDIVSKITNHFERIRESKALIAESDRPPIFQLSPHVMSSEKEIEYLRTVSELLIMFLLPRTYSLSPTKYFIREVLCCKVFKPFIDNITDPDFFNRHVINYIEANRVHMNLPKKGTFESANNFEDLIDRIDDVQVLRSIRYNIVTKLMQATTLQNLNRAKGVDLDNDKITLSSAGVQKSDINAAKKLKKHINQLTSAKKQCEKKLISLGWDSGYQYGDELKRSQVVQTIEDKYYQSFLISDYYKEMVIAIENEDNIAEVDANSLIEDRQTSTDSAGSPENGLNVGDHSSYARRKLDQLEEKLNNKTQIPDEKEPPQFVLVVQMAEDDTYDGEGAICTGWVVCRSLTQFQELHKKLRPLCSEIRNIELPSNTFKFLFGKTDKLTLERAKQQVQKYLDFVLKDDRLNQSEAIYSFLIKIYDDNKDTIAEPLYGLLSEIFDMRGVFKYVRKTLIGFVQVTYGRNINKQIHETISWWFSEEMLHYYITLILKNFWPGGSPADLGPHRTKEERLQTANKAQEMFINNVPELLTTLVGNNAARNGAKKVFDALQEKNMNKHLFYELVEVTLDAIFPELS
ncbi:hypothetical protein NQ314_008150 [Rhamnusium bicolor]|uniref:Sorting nexin-25 n=1 Tax=Rhamnusium bicolor TaxID=1586634 RepID=A0AAV8YF78_9CUCU|nr:hypothetical protein NQ314_008150 [Rhamnusium bicolor]